MKKFKTAISLFMSAMFISASVLSVDAGTLKKPQIIDVININGEPTTLSPSLAQGIQETWIIDNMFKGLYTLTPEGVTELAIADSVNVSSDGLVWTFTLKDFWWSTGNKGNANDFVESFLFTLDPANNAKYQSSLWILKNGEGYTKGDNTVDELGVKALDNNTLEITLEKPVQYLPYLLSTFSFYPIDSANAERHKDWYKSNTYFSSNGPFVLSSWNEDKIVLTKSATYYNSDLTKLDQIHFDLVNNQDYAKIGELYNEDEIDLVYGLNADTLIQTAIADNADVSYLNDFSTYFVTFNTKKKPFNNPKIRKALSMSIDRDYLINEVLNNNANAAYSVTPQGVLIEKGNNYEDYVNKFGPSFEENISVAKMLLKEGLNEEAMSLNEFSFSYIYNDSESNKKVAFALQEMWLKNLGILCTLEKVEYKTLLDRRDSGIFDLARNSWSGDYLDPMTFLSLFTTKSEFNYGKYSNSLYDQYLAWADNNVTSLRTGQLLSAERILINDMAVMPVFFYTKPLVKQPTLDNIYSPVIGKGPMFEFAEIIEIEVTE